MPVSVPATVVVDNAAGFGAVPPTGGGQALRTLNLVIQRAGDHFRLNVVSNAPFFDPSESYWEAELPMTAAELLGAVQECRQAWQRAAVDHVVGGRYALQDAWDLAGTDVARDVLPALALAGSRLFERIFFPDGSAADAEPRSDLQRIGRVLRDELHKGRYWFLVTSDDFYAPWNLLYSKAITDRVDGSDAVAEGFWGYQHVVEHVPRRGARGPGLVGDRPFEVGVFWDDRIDGTLRVPCTAPVRDHLTAYAPERVSVAYATGRKQLGGHLAAPPVRDQLLYFCGHARADGTATQLQFDASAITLGDDQPVSPGDIDQWMGPARFERRPVVFLNACQGGQTNSLFYRAFAPVFLERGASAVIGAQTDVPAVFAGEFARRVLERFLAGSVRLGDVLADTRRELLDVHQNPLGLLYSLYRGGDVRLPGGDPASTGT